MTTFEMSELEVKAWAAWDDSQVLDSMGYDSYQEYLDAQVREATTEYRDFNESREF